MLSIFLIITAYVFRTVSLQNNLSCKNDFMCIPFSECAEVKDMIDKNVSFNHSSLFCGYFHEPFVCCDRNCVTPNGNYGKIVPLKNCSHLESNQESTDQKRKKFLLESHFNTTHICCNKNENTYKLVPPAPVNPTNKPSESYNSSCVTLNGEKAKCVHISDCELYKKVVNGTNEDFSFVNESFCGWWKQPLVCCGGVDYYKEEYSKKLPDEKNCGMWSALTHPNIPPWLALIQDEESKQVCVGMIINHEYILTTISCTKNDLKRLNIKIGNCINGGDTYKNCTFRVRELKIFPHHIYIPSEDTGIVLLKLNQPIKSNDTSPVCLHMDELALSEEVNVIYLEQLNKQWITKRLSTSTVDNTSCRNEMGFYYEKILCLRNAYFCGDSKKIFLQSFVLYEEDDRWYLDGLFNKEDGCYGSTKDYFNGVYVYKFIPWIKSNID